MSEALEISNVVGPLRRGVTASSSGAATARIPSIGEIASEQFGRTWRAKVTQRLQKLLELDLGWNGYDAKPIDVTTAHFSFRVLEQVMRPGVPVPSIMPLAYGGLQIEWHRKGWDIEIEIARPNEIHVWKHNLTSKKDFEHEFSSDLTKLPDLILDIAD